MSITPYHCQKANTGDFRSETPDSITTLCEGDASHARFAAIGRNHWSAENKNHWRKGATVWRENRGVRHKPRGAENLALLRNATLALIGPRRHDSLNLAFRHYADHRAEVRHLITKVATKNP